MGLESTSATPCSYRIAFGSALGLTIAAAIACGGYFGLLAQAFYVDFGPTPRPLTGSWGLWAGVASGAVVGAAWSWAIERRARAQLREGKLRCWRLLLSGVLLGLVAGCVSALCVHGTLKAITGELGWLGFEIGLAFGAISGPIVGLLGGLLVLVAARFALSHR